MLQSQLNPHFLFNTFNTISAFTETDPKTARQMMARLGKLLRSSLDHAGRQEVTLGEELTFLENYISIERMRFEDRLTVDVRIEDHARDALVPSFVLQPLVENAIRHGTGALLRSGHVQVSAGRVGARLTSRSMTMGLACRKAGVSRITRVSAYQTSRGASRSSTAPGTHSSWRVEPGVPSASGLRCLFAAKRGRRRHRPRSPALHEPAAPCSDC